MRITPQNFPDPERGRIFTSFCQHTFYWGKNSWLGWFQPPTGAKLQSSSSSYTTPDHHEEKIFLIIVKVSFVESKMWWGETIIIMFALFALVWRSKFFHLTDSSPATLTIDLWRAGEVPRGEFLVFLGGFLMGSVTMTEHLLLRWEIPATDAINLLESCSFHDPLSLHSCNDLHAGVDNKFA